MLSSLKQFTSSWIAQLLLGLLVLSFAVWGIADIFNVSGGAVATVGKSEVSISDFSQRYDRYVQLIQAQTRRQVTQQQAVEFGIPNQVIGDLLGDATLDETARLMGLGMSDEELSRRITSDPNLIGPSGVYSEAYLQNIVEQQRMTLDEFVVAQEKDYIRRQIVSAFAGGVSAPDVYMRALSEFQDEARQVSYIYVPAPLAFDIADPDGATLDAFYEEHKSQWTAPEYRGARYFELSPEQLSSPADVTDEEIVAHYDDQISRFTTAERRTLERIEFASAEEAQAAAAELTSGTSFEDVASVAGMSADDIDFGTFTQSELIDEAVAEAAFSLSEGDVSGVVTGRFGPVILRVVETIPEAVQPLEEVEDDLRQEIALNLAADDVQTMHDQIEDERAGGTSLEDVAAKFGLEMTTVEALDSSGLDEQGNAVRDLPEGLTAGVFESDVGLENDPLRPELVTFVWYEVTSVTAPRDRELDEVRSEVVAAWKDDERERQAEATAYDIDGRLAAGENPNTVAEELGLEATTVEGVTRSSPPDGELSAQGVAAAFDGPDGHHAVTPSTSPLGRIAIVVDEVTIPPFFSGAPDLQPAEETLSNQISLELMQLYIAETRNELDYTINQALLNQLFSDAPDGAPQHSM